MSVGTSVCALSRHVSAASRYSAAIRSLPVSPYAAARSAAGAPAFWMAVVNDAYRSRIRDCTTGDALERSGSETWRKDVVGAGEVPDGALEVLLPDPHAAIVMAAKNTITDRAGPGWLTSQCLPATSYIDRWPRFSIRPPGHQAS